MSSSARTDFVLDALEQVLYERRAAEQAGLIHHADRSVQSVSIRYSERLAEATDHRHIAESPATA